MRLSALLPVLLLSGLIFACGPAPQPQSPVDTRLARSNVLRRALGLQPAAGSVGADGVLSLSDDERSTRFLPLPAVSGESECSERSDEGRWLLFDGAVDKAPVALQLVPGGIYAWQYLSERGCLSSTPLWSAGAMVLDGEAVLRLESSYEWNPEVVEDEDGLLSEEELLATAPPAELVEGTAELAGRRLRFRLGPNGVEMEREGTFEPLVLLPDAIDAETVTPELCGTYYQSTVEVFDDKAKLSPLLSSSQQGRAVFLVHLTAVRSFSAGDVECIFPTFNSLEYDRWVWVELDADELGELWVRERYNHSEDGGGGSTSTMDELIEARFALPSGELSYSETSASLHEAGWNYVEESLETEDPEVDFYDEETASTSWSWVFSDAEGLNWSLAEDSEEWDSGDECY